MLYKSITIKHVLNCPLCTMVTDIGRPLNSLITILLEPAHRHMLCFIRSPKLTPNFYVSTWRPTTRNSLKTTQHVINPTNHYIFYQFFFPIWTVWKETTKIWNGNGNKFFMLTKKQYKNMCFIWNFICPIEYLNLMFLETKCAKRKVFTTFSAFLESWSKSEQLLNFVNNEYLL